MNKQGTEFRKFLQGLLATAVIVATALSMSFQAVGGDKEARIMNGDAVRSMENYPYLAGILSLNSQNNLSGFRCNGTLIADRWVLTERRCVNNDHPDQLRVSIWGADGRHWGDDYSKNMAGLREVIASYPLSGSQIIITESSAKNSTPAFTDGLALLLLKEPVTGVKPVSLVYTDGSYNQPDSDPLKIVGTGYLNTKSQLPGAFGTKPASGNVDDFTGFFNKSAQDNFVLLKGVNGQAPGLYSSDWGAPVLRKDSQGHVLDEMVAMIISGKTITPTSVSTDPGDFYITQRIAPKKGSIISVIGWSGQRPWQWNTATRADANLPTGTWFPERPDDSYVSGDFFQRLFPKFRTNRDTYLCRDSADNSPGELLFTDKSLTCIVIHADSSSSTPETFDVLTGSLFADYVWNDHISSLDDQAFTTTATAEGSGSGTQAEQSAVICRVKNQTPNATTAFEKGRLVLDMCVTHTNSYKDFQVLYPRNEVPPTAPGAASASTPTWVVIMTAAIISAALR